MPNPGAYLNYILFDRSYKVLDMGWTPAAGYNSLQKISIPTVNIKEAGYIFVYLSYENESNNYVQFDDFKVMHTKTNVIQYNEYYPFGLQTANSWTRENATGNNFLANGGTELNTTSSLYDLMFRNYDPVLGRMNGVDPMADKYSSVSPYNFAFNMPGNLNDPSGADPYYVSELDRYNAQAASGRRIMDSGTFGGGHVGWASQYRSKEWNMALMSTRDFESFYGVNMNNANDRFNVAREIAQGTEFQR